jgi:hypothetical protein
MNHSSYRGQNHHYSYWDRRWGEMITSYTAEQCEALKAANLDTNRVPLYYQHGRLSGEAIQGLIKHGVLVQAGRTDLC